MKVGVEVSVGKCRRREAIVYGGNLVYLTVRKQNRARLKVGKRRAQTYTRNIPKGVLGAEVGPIEQSRVSQRKTREE